MSIYTYIVYYTKQKGSSKMSVLKKICTSKVFTFVVVFALCASNVVCGNLWDGSGSQEAIANFSAFYQHWFIVFLGISIALYSFTKNEKIKGYAEGLIAGVIIVYLLTWGPVQQFIVNTFSAIADWLS